MRNYLAAALATLCLAQPVPLHAAEPAGIWLSEDGESSLKIAACGAKLCGSLAWMVRPNDAAGKPLLDTNNAVPALRSRPLLGIPVLLGLSRAGDNWTGNIYNPEDGKTYEGSFGLLGGDKAQIKGCVAAILCQTEVFTRQ